MLVKALIGLRYKNMDKICYDKNVQLSTNHNYNILILDLSLEFESDLFILSYTKLWKNFPS